MRNAKWKNLKGLFHISSYLLEPNIKKIGDQQPQKITIFFVKCGNRIKPWLINKKLRFAWVSFITWLFNKIYLLRKAIYFCFYCFVVTMKSLKPSCLLLCSWYHWKKPLMSRGALSWFHTVLTYNGGVIWILNKFFYWELIQIKTKNHRGISVCFWYFWKTPSLSWISWRRFGNL
jgi:hypothetical protein